MQYAVLHQHCNRVLSRNLAYLKPLRNSTVKQTFTTSPANPDFCATMVASISPLLLHSNLYLLNCRHHHIYVISNRGAYHKKYHFLWPKASLQVDYWHTSCTKNVKFVHYTRALCFLGTSTAVLWTSEIICKIKPQLKLRWLAKKCMHFVPLKPPG